jgi:hypothetical protein
LSHKGTDMPFSTFFKRSFAARGTPYSRKSFRPWLEVLEDRCCPSSVGPDVYEQIGMGTFSNPVNLGPTAPGTPLHFSQSSLSVYSAIAAGADEWFKFSLTGSSTPADQAVVQFTDANVASHMTARLFTDHATRLIRQSPPPNLSLDGLTAGTYLLQITNDGSSTFGYYTLSLDISPADPTTPFNLTPVNHATVTTLSPTFTWAAAAGAAAHTWLYLQDMTLNDGAIYISDNPASLLSGHVYQWFVQSYSGTPQSSPFTLTVQVPDANEPNNSATTATNLGTATPTAPLTYATNASIYQVGDVDWYSFTVPTGKTALGDNATMSVNHYQGILQMALYQETWARILVNGQTVWSTQNKVVATSTSFHDPNFGPEGEYLGLGNLASAATQSEGAPTGKYFIKVLSDNNIPNKYALNVSLSPVTDPFPTLNAPGAGGQVASLHPSLSWKNAAGAVSYQVWMNDLSSGKNNIFLGATATINNWAPPANLVSGDTYRWWVRGIDQMGNSLPWSYSNDFTVSTVVFAPINGPIPSEYPAITWTGVQGASFYSIWIANLTTGAGNLFPNITVPGSDTLGATFQWQLDSANANVFLVPGNTYSIWVKANNSNGQGAWSGGQSFTIGTITFAKPQTAFPMLRPTIPFTPISGANGALYELDDLTTGQADLFPKEALTGNSWSPKSNLTLFHSYRLWGKVSGPSQASFNSGAGWWGPGVDFTINTSIAPLPTAQTLRPTLTWDTLAAVTNYEVWVIDNAGGGNLTPGLLVNTNSWTPSFDLISGDNYTMWVRAQNGPWSAAQTFQIATVSQFGGTINTLIFEPLYYVKWTPLTGVKDYLLWLTDVTTGADNLSPGQVVNQPGTLGALSAQWQLPSSFDVHHTYKLWIKARNQNNQAEWGAAFTFVPADFPLNE